MSEPVLTPADLTPAARDRRQRVQQAVRELMGELGYRVSMEAVALRAGCSKQTLYSDYGSKQELLRTMMQEHLLRASAPFDSEGHGVRETLLMFAEEHLALLSDPSVIAACHLLAAQSQQYPEEASALYRDGCQAMQERLALWLQAAMDQGDLRRDDPHLAAELLMSMIGGLDMERQRLAVQHRDSEQQRRDWLEFAIDNFMRAFTANAAPPAAKATTSRSSATTTRS